MAAKALPVLLALAAVQHVHGFRDGNPENNGMTVEDADRGLAMEDADRVKNEVETDVKEAEETIEAVTGVLGENVELKPIKGTFEVGGSMDEELGRKMSQTLLIWRDRAPCASSSPWLEAKMKAKDVASGARFLNKLATSLASFGWDQFVTASLQGDELTLTSIPIDVDENFTHAMGNLSKHIHHANLTEEVLDIDLAGMLKSHSQKLILQELYKGLKVTVDAALTPVLEDSIGSVAGPEARPLKVMAKLFQGLFFDVHVQYASEAMRDALSIVPGLNATAQEVIEAYRLRGQAMPMHHRGHPLHVATLDLLDEAEQCLESVTSFEILGLPFGVRAALKYTHVNPFPVINALLKEAGIDKVLRNETFT